MSTHEYQRISTSNDICWSSSFRFFECIICCVECAKYTGIRIRIRTRTRTHTHSAPPHSFNACMHTNTNTLDIGRVSAENRIWSDRRVSTQYTHASQQRRRQPHQCIAILLHTRCFSTRITAIAHVPLLDVACCCCWFFPFAMRYLRLIRTSSILACIGRIRSACKSHGQAISQSPQSWPACEPVIIHKCAREPSTKAIRRNSIESNGLCDSPMHGNRTIMSFSSSRFLFDIIIALRKEKNGNAYQRMQMCSNDLISY